MRKITGPLFDAVIRPDGLVDLEAGHMSPPQEVAAVHLAEAFASMATTAVRAHFFPEHAYRSVCGIKPGLDRDAPNDAPRCPTCSVMAEFLQPGSEN